MQGRILLSGFLLLAVSAQAQSPVPIPHIPSNSAIDTEARRIMAQTHANGMAIAFIDKGNVQYVQAYGIRNANGDSLSTNTIMYGASLTKTVFAYTVMELVDKAKIDLDKPIAAYLENPLPSYGVDPGFLRKYGPYKDLAGDQRWENISPRNVLTQSTGFANFWFLEPDHKLQIHFDPGTRYSYSGEGYVLLQFAIEHGRQSQGLGIDVGDLTNDVFNKLNMPRTSLTWRNDFGSNAADGWNDQGQVQTHNHNSKVRAAGSLDTTISDFAQFTAALVRGEGLSGPSFNEMTRPQLHITTAHQFPVLEPDLPLTQQRDDLYAGLGVVLFRGPQGNGFEKGGHDSTTANTMVCMQALQRCVVILSNDARAEAGFRELVHYILGETGVPYDWDYGSSAGKS